MWIDKNALYNSLSGTFTTTSYIFHASQRGQFMREAPRIKMKMHVVCTVGIRANMDVPALSYVVENERGWAGLCAPAVISCRPEENSHIFHFS